MGILLEKINDIQKTQKNLLDMMKCLKDQQEETASVVNSNAKALKKYKKKSIDEYMVSVGTSGCSDCLFILAFQ